MNTIIPAATKSNTEYAYMQMFYANDRKERKNLLQHILTDQHFSLLFLLHCSPTIEEFNLVFNTISDDIDSCGELLRKKIKCLPGNIRTASLNTVMRDPDASLVVVKEAALKIKEKKRIYMRHRDYYLLEKTLNNYWNKWLLFKDVMEQNEVDTLIGMINELEHCNVKNIIETMLSYHRLTDIQKEKLDSKILATKLYENVKSKINTHRIFNLNSSF